MHGVVSTMSLQTAPTDAPLASFLSAHSAVGFDRFFIFFDDEAPLPDVLYRPGVRAWTRAESRARYATCPSYEKLGAHLADVSSRQILNAEIALAAARDEGVRWLVHLDLDELFFLNARSSLALHFEELDALGICQLTYANHEGVPETEEVGDYFREVTLFRRHPAQVPMSAAARRAMNFWRQRTAHAQYFLFYDNGKSAVKVDTALHARNQHVWVVSGRSAHAFADPRQLDPSALHLTDNPKILHFPVCGCAWFSGKYRKLGRFANTWAGGVTIPPCLHLDARTAAGVGDEALKCLFRKEVLLSDAAEAADQVAAGVCFRTHALAEMLHEEEDRRAFRAPEESRTEVPEEAPAPALPMSLQGSELGWVLGRAVRDFL